MLKFDFERPEKCTVEVYDYAPSKTSTAARTALDLFNQDRVAAGLMKVTPEKIQEASNNKKEGEELKVEDMPEEVAGAMEAMGTAVTISMVRSIKMESGEVIKGAEAVAEFLGEMEMEDATKIAQKAGKIYGEAMKKLEKKTKPGAKTVK